MSETPTLFDPPTARQAMADGIQRADDNADELWKETALDGVQLLARRMDEFTTDELIAWLERCEEDTHNKAALGPVMQRAARLGWIENTGRMVQSKIPRRHRKITVWRSLLRGTS